MFHQILELKLDILTKQRLAANEPKNLKKSMLSNSTILDILFLDLNLRISTLFNLYSVYSYT